MTNAKQDRAKKIMTLANKITLFRILLIPAIVIFLIEDRLTLATALLVFSILTDLLDGLAARWLKEQTRLGAFLDPLADKLLLISIFLALTYLGRLEVWVFVVVFSRDLLIVIGWAVIYILTGSNQIRPRMLGKVTTALQMVAATLLITPAPPALKNACILIAVVFTCVSALDYIVVTERRLGEWN